MDLKRLMVVYVKIFENLPPPKLRFDFIQSFDKNSVNCTFVMCSPKNVEL